MNLIEELINYNLKLPIKIEIERDEDFYIGKLTEINQIYSFGETKEETIENLKYNIEELYEDLNEDENLSDEIKNWKIILNNHIGEKKHGISDNSTK